MKLRNRFSEIDKHRVWEHHKFCVICKSNQNCSLHHIDGCKEKIHSSIYNSVMLCHNHHKEADSHNTASPLSQAFRAGLRNYTYRLIEKSDYQKTTNDEKYIAKHTPHIPE